MRDVIDATIVFIKALNLTEASVEIEQRLGHGDKYTFKIGDQSICAEIFFEYVRLDTGTDVIYEKDYLAAKDLFAMRIFRNILAYISNEHA